MGGPRNSSTNPSTSSRRRQSSCAVLSSRLFASRIWYPPTTYCGTSLIIPAQSLAERGVTLPRSGLGGRTVKHLDIPHSEQLALQSERRRNYTRRVNFLRHCGAPTSCLNGQRQTFTFGSPVSQRRMVAHTTADRPTTSCSPRRATVTIRKHALPTDESPGRDRLLHPPTVPREKDRSEHHKQQPT